MTQCENLIESKMGGDAGVTMLLNYFSAADLVGIRDELQQYKVEPYPNDAA